MWDGLCRLGRRCRGPQRGLDVGNRNGAAGARPGELCQVQASVGCAAAGQRGGAQCSAGRRAVAGGGLGQGCFHYVGPGDLAIAPAAHDCVEIDVQAVGELTEIRRHRGRCLGRAPPAQLCLVPFRPRDATHACRRRTQVGEDGAHGHFRSDRDDDFVDDAVFEHLDLDG